MSDKSGQSLSITNRNDVGKAPNLDLPEAPEEPVEGKSPLAAAHTDDSRLVSQLRDVAVNL